ncbi:putative leucine-rich repeat-containing protein DDB_G0290503 isoform X2 [Mytilus edulis]|uniref:putative leucine-rich repeat-containing protein DDB_G0290503 isoform X2 n=1 Tax=Mytilus edulis TaxID=6550 RepID=UPI0039EF2546
MDTPFVAQVTEDLNTRKILQTRETIMTFTGRPPKDASHIEEVKHMIETFPHPNLDNVVHQRDTGGTVPVDSDIWGKLSDFRSLTDEQQRETREFLLMRFSIEDLQLAWDQYFVQKGEIPNCLQYRIFINNWRAEMMRTIEKKDDEIYHERDEQQLLHSQLELVNHIYNGQLRRVHDLEQDNNFLRDNIHQLENEVEQKSEDNNRIRDITEVQGRHVYQLRRTITQKDRQICDQCSQLRELEDTKGEYGSVIKRQKMMIKEKKDEVKAQSATINEINVQNEEQSATIHELNVKDEEKSATINEQSATIHELNVKDEEKSATINEQSATIHELNVKDEEKSATINEQSATINDLIEQNHDKSKTINEMCEQNNKAIDNLNSKIDMEVHVGQTKEQIIAEQSQLIEEQKAIIEKQKESLMKYKKNDEDLRRQMVEQDRINQDLYDQLKDVKMLCNKLMMKIQAKSQNQ